MSIEDDFVLLSNGHITLTDEYSQGSYSVLEFHRWLQELADQPENMTLPVPSTRYTDHMITLEEGFSISEEAARRLHSGSLNTSNGAYCSNISIKPTHYDLPPVRKIRND